MEKKKVLLIGDSIRMGYDKYVKNYLADSCEVYYPSENCRFAQFSNVRKYNDIAVEICKKHGHIINDLYSLSENVPEEYYSDMTHLYTPEGTQLLTDAVIKVICNTLDIEYKKFTLADYESVKEVIGL